MSKLSKDDLKNWRLPKPLKAKWLRALRSGKYAQGSGALAEEDGDELKYCCLGVLGKVCGMPQRALEDGFFLKGKAALKAIGTSIPMPVQSVLAAMNDSEGVSSRGQVFLSVRGIVADTSQESSFTDIANWIKKHL